jgi:hypothetical protein
MRKVLLMAIAAMLASTLTAQQFESAWPVLKP